LFYDAKDADDITMESTSVGHQIHVVWAKFVNFDRQLAISRKWYNVDTNMVSVNYK